MDRLPQEILAHIAAQLPNAKKAPYACISRAWQAVVEHQTFRSLLITSLEFDAFAGLFNDRNICRRRFLTRLLVSFELPAENVDICCVAARVSDCAADASSLSESITELFKILSRIASRAGSGNPRLHLGFQQAYKASDIALQKLEYDQGLLCRDRKHAARDIVKARQTAPLFELPLDESRPLLEDVERFQFRSVGHLEQLRSSWIPRIVDKLPGVASLDIHTPDWFEWGRRRRMKRRQDVSNSISQIATSTELKDIRLTVYHSGRTNEDGDLPDLIPEGKVEQDPYTMMFRHLSDQPALSVLHLTGPMVIAPGFFASLSEGSFPALTDFCLEFSAEAANGEWFFIRDQRAFDEAETDPNYADWFQGGEEDSDDDLIHYNYDSSENSDEDILDQDGPPLDISDDVAPNRFRSLPNDSALEPLILGAATALQAMPRIRRFGVKVSEGWEQHRTVKMSYPFVQRVFEIWFVKSSNLLHGSGPRYLRVAMDEDLIDHNRLYWRTGTWRPNREVLRAWEETAGQDAKILRLAEDRWDRSRGDDMAVYTGELELID